MNALLWISTVPWSANKNLIGQRLMQRRRQLSEPNLFVHDFKKRKETKGKRKNYRKPMKSKPVVRVGGRRVSAAIVDKTKYVFPVEISHVNSTNQ
jgi:hypothetical protein